MWGDDENLEHKLRKMRLRWFGHVNENSILRRAMELEV